VIPTRSDAPVAVQLVGHRLNEEHLLANTRDYDFALNNFRKK
jgi:Asp-tRNA(Asn)/Glu-tRNA(Gln) amidotransferase A subunit family amidase